MEKKILGGKITIEKPEFDLSIQNNFKILNTECTKTHLTTLGKMLRMLSRLVYEKVPDVGGENPYFQQYLLRLGDTLDSIVLKNKINSMGTHYDVMQNCSIDPTESGFPTICTHFYYLGKDKQIAEQALKELSQDAQLVSSTLFSLFRGVFPKDVIVEKLKRNYYQKLSELELPESLKTYPEDYIKKQDNMHYLTKSVEKLDENNNLPRFYTLRFLVTNQSYSGMGWKKELENKIRESLSTLTAYELLFLAKNVEEIDGIQMQMLERFDVGPFYNYLTINNDAINRVLKNSCEEDAILAFRSYSVHRIGEEKRKGIESFIMGLFSGDKYRGNFSPILKSPKYMLMPHRLIQKIHNLGIDFGEEVKLFGITNTGGLIG